MEKYIDKLVQGKGFEPMVTGKIYDISPVDIKRVDL